MPNHNAAMGDVTLLYQDEHLVAADKPAGLLAVPGRGDDKQDCLWARVRAQVPDALIVHRLDMATSGLMLFGCGAQAQRQLSAAFEQRRVDKRYEALVAGIVEADSGEINLPLAADWPNRPRQQVDRERGRASLTRWQVLLREPVQGATRLALEPLTGRSHQLRLHLSAIGHPIVGDELYGGPPAARLLLHACALRLPHPDDGQMLALHSSVPF